MADVDVIGELAEFGIDSWRKSKGLTKEEIEEKIKLLKEDADEVNLIHGNAMEELPDWFDEAKFRRGQEFFKRNYYSLFVSKLCGLLVILSIPRVLRILIMTQKSSSSLAAFKRYLSTLSHMLMWYNGDILDKNSWAYKSLKEVHAKHMAANNRGIAEKAGTLSQSSLAMTQFGFMGFGLLMPEKLGIRITDEKDLEGFVHFWRAIGYLIGIRDEYNICGGTVEETKEICKKILEEILWPNLKCPTREFVEMTKALLEGMWAIIPFLDVEGFTAFTYDLAGLEIVTFTNWWSRSMYNFQKWAHETLKNRIIGEIWRVQLNFHMWLAVLISSKYPYLTRWLEGPK